MENGDVNGQGFSERGTTLNVCWPFSEPREGYVQFWGPSRIVGKFEESVTDTVMAPVQTSARARQGMIPHHIHWLVAGRAYGVWFVAW